MEEDGARYYTLKSYDCVYVCLGQERSAGVYAELRGHVFMDANHARTVTTTS